jgi:hypothetical protein
VQESVKRREITKRRSRGRRKVWVSLIWKKGSFGISGLGQEGRRGGTQEIEGRRYITEGYSSSRALSSIEI